MKTRILYSAVTLVAFLIFLIATMPMQRIWEWLPNKQGVVLSGISGSLWQGSVEQIRYRNDKVDNVRWSVRGASLLTGKIMLDVKFGRGQAGISGKGGIGYGFSGLLAENLYVTAPADWAVERAALPLPVSVTGRLALVIEQGAQGAPWCDTLTGVLSWSQADIDTPVGMMKLADPEAILSCDQGELVATVKQSSSHMELDGVGRLAAGNNYSFEGKLKAGSALPGQIEQNLRFIGAVDSQGRYRLQYKGQL